MTIKEKRKYSQLCPSYAISHIDLTLSLVSLRHLYPVPGQHLHTSTGPYRPEALGAQISDILSFVIK